MREIRRNSEGSIYLIFVCDNSIKNFAHKESTRRGTVMFLFCPEYMLNRNMFRNILYGCVLVWKIIMYVSGIGKEKSYIWTVVCNRNMGSVGKVFVFNWKEYWRRFGTNDDVYFHICEEIEKNIRHMLSPSSVEVISFMIRSFDIYEVFIFIYNSFII